MKYSTRKLFIGPRGVLLFAALLIVFAALSLLTNERMRAQAPPPHPDGGSNQPAPAPPGTDQVPTAPKLTATAIEGNVIELRWTSVSSAVRYELWVQVDGGSEQLDEDAWGQLDDGDLTGTTYIHTGLSTGTTYNYKMRTVDAVGVLGAWSKTVSATASVAPPPTSTPTVQVYRPPSQGERGPSTYPDGESIYPGPGWVPAPPGSNPFDAGPPTLPDDGSNQGGPEPPAPTTTPTMTSTATSTPTVTATASATPTSTSTPTPTLTPTSEPTATPTATASALLAPGMTAEATGWGIELKWEAAAGAVRYELMTWWDGANGWQPLGGDDLTGTAFRHTEVSAGTKYYYSIRAVNAAGKTSDWLSDYPFAVAIAAKEARTAAPTATATAPALPAPGMTAKATVRGVALSWEATVGAVRYELMTWWDGAGGWQSIRGDDLTGTTYTHTDVAAGTKYYYTIRAVNAAKETSGWLEDFPSAIAIAVTEAVRSTPTPTPTATAPALSAPGMTAKATVRGVELSWEVAAGAVRYELITWWDGAGGWQLFGGDELTGTMYMHTDVEAGTKYYYTIRAVNAAGESSGWLQDFATATALEAGGN